MLEREETYMSDTELAQRGEQAELRHYRGVIIVGFSTCVDEDKIPTVIREDFGGAPAFDYKTWATFITRVRSQDETRATDRALSDIIGLGQGLAGCDEDLRRRHLLLLRQELEKRELLARHQRELSHF